jgi:glycosyltransferase involved in cell wall biosynthesis
MSLYGGAELVVDKFASVLRKQGHICDVATLSLSKDVREKCQGITFILPRGKYKSIIRSTSLLAALGILREAFALRQLVEKGCQKYDVVNIHNFPATWAAAGINKPIVWMCNEPPDLWNNPNPNFILRLLRFIGLKIDNFIVNRFIDKICVADENNAKRIEERHGLKPEIVNYGIGYNFFSRAKPEKFFQKKYGLEDKFVLIQVGTLTPQKNQLESLEAVKNLVKKIPEIKIIFAGMGGTDYEKKIQQYIKKYNLAKYVVLTGQVSQKIIRDLYAVSHLALFPVKTQGGWLSPFEALSTGIPIIVSSSMGAASVIQENNLGIVADNLIDPVLRVYQNYDKMKKEVEISRKWIKKNLSWENFSNKMILVFENVINLKQKEKNK